MSHLQKISKTALAVICMISILFTSNFGTSAVYASSGYRFVLLSAYSKTMKIGDEFCLAAVTSNGKRPSFSTNHPRVASVSAYGRITAKRAGSAVITAKIKNGEARCKITVKRTAVRLSAERITLKKGETARLRASVSTGHPVTYKSSKSSVASVDKKGTILAKKPGIAVITATADKTSAACKITVRYPNRKPARVSQLPDP